MTIKRKLVFVGAVVLILILAFISMIAQRGGGDGFSKSDTSITNLADVHCADIEVAGTNVTLAVFTIEPPVDVSVVYQKGELRREMKQYPWLKALLFGCTGIEAFIPKEEWGDYAAYGWTEETYAIVSSLRAPLEIAFREDEFWAGARRQVSQVVLCVLNGERYLQINLDSWQKNGKRIPPHSNKLQFIDGKWKRFADYDNGALALFLIQCHKNALKLVEEGKLQVNPIKELR